MGKIISFLWMILMTLIWAMAFWTWWSSRLLNYCQMSYMHPEYFIMEQLGRNGYSVYEYDDSRYMAIDRPIGHILIFIPGNAGNYEQVRSLGSAVLQASASKPKRWVIYTLDFGEQHTAFSNSILEQQLAFIRSLLYSFYTSMPGIPITLVGHSMGGILAMKTSFSSDVHAVFTISTPLKAPILLSERSMHSSYQYLHNNPNVFSLHIHGGRSDALIRPDLVHMDTDLARSSEDWVQVWAGMDHRASVWCRQAMQRLAFIVTKVGASNASIDKMSSVLEKQHWPRVMEQALPVSKKPVVAEWPAGTPGYLFVWSKSALSASFNGEKDVGMTVFPTVPETPLVLGKESHRATKRSVDVPTHVIGFERGDKVQLRSKDAKTRVQAFPGRELFIATWFWERPMRLRAPVSRLILDVPLSHVVVYTAKIHVLEGPAPLVKVEGDQAYWIRPGDPVRLFRPTYAAPVSVWVFSYAENYVYMEIDGIDIWASVVRWGRFYGMHLLLFTHVCLLWQPSLVSVACAFVPWLLGSQYLDADIMHAALLFVASLGTSKAIGTMATCLGWVLPRISFLEQHALEASLVAVVFSLYHVVVGLVWMILLAYLIHAPYGARVAVTHLLPTMLLVPHFWMGLSTYIPWNMEYFLGWLLIGLFVLQQWKQVRSLHLSSWTMDLCWCTILLGIWRMDLGHGWASDFAVPLYRGMDILVCFVLVVLFKHWTRTPKSKTE